MPCLLLTQAIRFLKFDLKRLRYQKVTAIPLAPEQARVGIEIRVVGNDAGEKVRILFAFFWLFMVYGYG